MPKTKGNRKAIASSMGRGAARLAYQTHQLKGDSTWLGVYVPRASRYYMASQRTWVSQCFLAQFSGGGGRTRAVIAAEWRPPGIFHGRVIEMVAPLGKLAEVHLAVRFLRWLTRSGDPLEFPAEGLLKCWWHPKMTYDDWDGVGRQARQVTTNKWQPPGIFHGRSAGVDITAS